MKKGTRTWKLWAMIFFYCLFIVTSINVYAEYIISVELNEFIQISAAVILIIILAGCISKIVNLLIKILKRKQLW